MMKRWIVFLLVTFTISTVNAQQQVTVKMTNQYGAPIKKVTIIAGGVSTEYKLQKDGKATVLIPVTDSITVTAEDHDNKRMVYQSLSDKSVIELKKQFTWKDLLNPKFYIVYGGLWLLLFIIFAETGLLAGFFLPGDSLLFVAGIFSKDLIAYLLGKGGTGSDFIDLMILMILITICGILGNTAGYWFGKKSGPFLFTRKDTFLFKKKHLLKAKDFYEKHGGQAIVFARFLPIVRTFAPIVAGIVGMDKKKFMYYNIIGCIAWVASMLLAGHYLYKLFLNKFNFDLTEHLEAIVIGIILVTTLPVIYKLCSKETLLFLILPLL
jgi:membrane-associated protein